MKIRFVVNKDYDSRVFFSLLQGEHWESRLNGSGISKELASKIHDARSKKEIKLAKGKFGKVVNQAYERCLPYIEKLRRLYQESWDEIIDDFSKTVAELTKPWFYDEYVCVVTHFCKGVSNWNGNVIGRTWKENPFTQRRITAHEILLAHYFSIYRNYYSGSGLKDRQIWALAEIAAWALTGLEPKLQKFWPWDTSGYYTDHNYPELVDLQLKLKEPFLKRKNFDEYIKIGIKEITALHLGGGMAKVGAQNTLRVQPD
ncbi:MAG: hypothetical protein ACOZBZ_01395 [Patescibacteria group bacterium]